MRAELALCPHLAAVAPGAAPFTLAPAEILEWDGAPVVAVARCAVCGACAWLERIEGPSFSLAALRAEDAALYFRNVSRGSCDVARARAEREALAASAGPRERRVVLDAGGQRVVAASPFAPGS